MRKVFFQYWIFPVLIDTSKPKNMGNIQAGTNCFSEPESGYFHQWGTEIHEDEQGFSEETVAIVESVKTGYIHTCQPGKIRFVLPPEVSHSEVVIVPLEKEMD